MNLIFSKEHVMNNEFGKQMPLLLPKFNTIQPYPYEALSYKCFYGRKVVGIFCVVSFCFGGKLLKIEINHSILKNF